MELHHVPLHLRAILEKLTLIDKKRSCREIKWVVGLILTVAYIELINALACF